MAVYIATFFSHFGAIRFHRELTGLGVNGVLMPVPRAVSSSCGTCVRYEAETQSIPASGDVEALFRQEADGRFTLISSEY